ncbi:MAG: hypothetical protein R3F53_21675 [Gammaproteobacteria bacterium]
MSTPAGGNTLTTGNSPQNLTVAFGQTTSATPIGYQPSPTSDDDGDGISNSDEINAPNGGDGNFDGLFDFLQGHVASLPNPLTGDYLTSTVEEACAPIEQTSIKQERAFGFDPRLDTLLGLLGFELPCASATVTVFYHGLDELPSRLYRKYGPTTLDDPATETFYTLPDVSADHNTRCQPSVSTQRSGELGDNEAARPEADP